MAFSFNVKDTVKIISSLDSSLDKSSPQFDEKWDAYTKTLDESNLTFLPDLLPTRFVLKTQLNYKGSQIIDNMKVRFENGQASPQLGFIIEEIRILLVDIENPCIPVVFKKESDGFASKELVAFLHSVGIVNELYAIKSTFLQADKDIDNVKKS